MRIRWRNFELPSQVRLDQGTASDRYGKFIVEPFEKGFGTTVGNGLRRVLLSSIEGTAVTSVRIDGVVHEYSSVPGMLEDVTHIILNIKKLRVRMHTDAPCTLRIDVSREGEVTAADIETDHNVEIVNTDLKICTLTENVRFYCEMQVRKGRGYVTAEENVSEDLEVGTIPVDSIFSPVYRVKYAIENTRVGKLTNYDRLILEIWTDGTITPEQALVEASKIYRKHLNPFIQLFDVGKELVVDRSLESVLPTIPSAPPAAVPAVSIPSSPASAASTGGDDLKDLRRKIELPIAALDLSVRASNSLEAEGIQTIGDLVGRSHDDLMNLPNFGRTSLREITRKLEEMNLRLGMDVDDIRGGI